MADSDIGADRVLTVDFFPPQQLAAALAGEGAGHYELGGSDKHFPLDEWTLVSHALDVRADGSAVLSMVYERRR